jgi:hypothetical protein
MDTEHIYIGDEFADLAGEPRTVGKTDIIRNRINESSYELTFYDEGFLNVRETRRNGRNREHMLELRFLEPRPKSAKRHATGCLIAALVLGILALITSMVLPSTPFAEFTAPATVLAITMATICLLLFVYRSQEIFQFRTASGRAVVSSLSASFGCIRKMRNLVSTITQAIEQSKQHIRLNDTNYLRAEMKAHYKLAETGVISREACSDGTTLILSRFG